MSGAFERDPNECALARKRVRAAASGGSVWLVRRRAGTPGRLLRSQRLWKSVGADALFKSAIRGGSWGSLPAILIKSGQILAPRQGPPPHIRPNGICGYAVAWALFTRESEPRLIESFPAGDPALGRSGV